jgi:hypothetical protein
MVVAALIGGGLVWWNRSRGGESEAATAPSPVTSAAVGTPVQAPPPSTTSGPSTSSPRPSTSTSVVALPAADPALGRESVEVAIGETIGAVGGEFAAPGVRVVIPGGAISTSDGVRVSAGDVVDGGTASEVFGTAIGIDHAEPMSAPVEVRWDIAGLTDAQRAALILVHFDDELGVWSADPPTLDVPRRIEGNELVADIQDWSDWSWSSAAAGLSQWVGERTGTRVESPTCTRSLPDWASNPVDPDQDTSAAAIRVCYESDDSGGVTLRVANNRTFTQQLRIVDGASELAWKWRGESELSVDRAVDEIAWDFVDDTDTFLLPPMQEVAVGIARPAGTGSFHIALEADVNPATMLVDLAKYGISKALSLDVTSDPVMNAFVTVLFRCGAEELLKFPDADVDDVARAVGSSLYACANLIVDRKGDFGELYESIALRAVNTEGAAGRAIFERANRFAVKAASAFELIELGKITFYLSDQLANAWVGNLSLSFNARGTPQVLGAWTPTCSDATQDSNLLYRNIALRDEFADTSKELWQFDGWAAAAEQAVRPLATCDDDYLTGLADLLPTDWGDPRAAGVLADQIRAMVDRDQALSAPDSVIHQADDQSWYVDTGDVRHPIPDGGTYLCLTAWMGKTVIEVTPGQTATLTEGDAATCRADPAANHVLHLADDASWYVDSDLVRHAIPDGGTYECLVARGNSVIEVSPQQVEALTAGDVATCTPDMPNIVMRLDDGRSWYVDADNVRHPIPNGGTFLCLTAWRGAPLVNVLPEHAALLTEGDAAACRVDEAADHVIRESDGTAFFVDRDLVRHHIPDGGTYECLVNRGVPVIDDVSQQQVEAITAGGDASCTPPVQPLDVPDRIIHQADNRSWYVDASNVRHPIPDGGTFLCLQAWRGKAVVEVTPEQTATLTEGEAATCRPDAANRVIRAADGTAYFVDGNLVRHHIQTGGAFNCLVHVRGVPVIDNVTPAHVDALAAGDPAPCTALVIGPDGVTSFYLDGSDNRLWVPDGGVFNCLDARPGVDVFRYSDWNTINLFVDDPSKHASCG